MLREEIKSQLKNTSGYFCPDCASNETYDTDTYDYDSGDGYLCLACGFMWNMSYLNNINNQEPHAKELLLKRITIK